MLHRTSSPPINRNSSNNMRILLNQDQGISNNVDIPININRIKDLEAKLHEYENTTIDLLTENDKLKANLSKLITSYPKEYIFDKIIEDKCSICLERYRLGDEIVVTNCIHLFHKICMDRSIDSDCINCPNCRFSLNNSVFLYLKFNLEIDGTDFL